MVAVVAPPHSLLYILDVHFALVAQTVHVCVPRGPGHIGDTAP